MWKGTSPTSDRCESSSVWHRLARATFPHVTELEFIISHLPFLSRPPLPTVTYTQHALQAKPEKILSFGNLFQKHIYPF